MNNFFRSGSGGSRFSFFPPVLKWLLGLNIGIYALEALLGSMRLGGVPLGYYLHRFGYLFPFDSPSFIPTQLFTYMFMHAGLTHLLFNMLALWMFGMQLEQVWGSKKFLIYYLLCGLGGGIAHMIMSPVLSEGMAGPLVGASGAIFGLLIGFGLLFPEQPIYLYFFFPIKAKYFVALYIGLEVMFLSNGSSDGVSHLAHLGGAVVGIVYMLVSVGVPTILSNFKSRSRDERVKSIWQGGQQNGGMFKRPDRDDEPIEAEYHEVGTAIATKKTDARGMRIITQADVDAILDKIGASGYQSLSQEERDILSEASKKMDERGRS